LPSALRRACSARSANSKNLRRAWTQQPGFQDRPRFAIGLIELVVSAIGISLENPSVVCQMCLRMFARTITRVVEHCRRRRAARKRSIIAHINPTSPGGRLAFGEHWHRGVVAVQSFRREHVGFNPSEDRFEHGAAGTNLVG